MDKICLNTRDDMLIIDLDKIVFIKANGNYTQLTYIEGQEQLLTIGLSKVEDIIKQAYPQGQPSPFVRMGRCFLINQNYLYAINILKQKLVLSDCAKHTYIIGIPKQLLKEYKRMIAQKYSPKEQ
ncbi:MAG: LytTR family transcriptional regulator [Prevotellaceae bacterium]|jgi:DNA-binding LytR/AlgR family response regulator|nr:LytTR family transcriptional regulator [Prevotellaceae bacterium]